MIVDNSIQSFLDWSCRLRKLLLTTFYELVHRRTPSYVNKTKTQVDKRSSFLWPEPAVLSNVASVDKSLIKSVNSSTLHTSSPNLQLATAGKSSSVSGSTGFLNTAAAGMSSYFPGGTLRKKSLSSLEDGEALVSSQPSQPRYTTILKVPYLLRIPKRPIPARCF